MRRQLVGRHHRVEQAEERRPPCVVGAVVDDEERRRRSAVRDADLPKADYHLEHEGILADRDIVSERLSDQLLAPQHV
jgi:hypothetical protein